MSFEHNAFADYGLFSFILCICCLLAMLVMLTHLVYHQWCRQNASDPDLGSDRESKSHCIAALISFVCFTLYIISELVLSSEFSFHGHHDYALSPNWCFVYYSHHNLYFLGKISMYFFWFIRIHRVFENSLFAVSTSKLKTMALCFTIPMVFITVTFTIVSWQSIQSASQHGQLEHLHDDADDIHLELHIDSFQVCNTLVSQYLAMDSSAALRYTVYAAIIVYPLNDIVYAIVVLRLFVANVLKLAVFTSEPRKVRPSKKHDIVPVLQTKYSLNTKLEKDKKSVKKAMKLMSGSVQHATQKKRHSLYLKVSIKIANLLIFTMCTNLFGVVHFMDVRYIPSWYFLFVIICNYTAIYLSFAFVSKHYRCLFSPCRNICYSLCAKLCYVCCCIEKVSDELTLSIGIGERRRPQPGKPSLEALASRSAQKLPDSANILSLSTNASVSVISVPSRLSMRRDTIDLEMVEIERCDSKSSAEDDDAENANHAKRLEEFV